MALAISKKVNIGWASLIFKLSQQLPKAKGFKKAPKRALFSKAFAWDIPAKKHKSPVSKKYSFGDLKVAFRNCYKKA